MPDKTDCSYAYLHFMKEENYWEAARCAMAMLEDYGDVVRHQEMMLTVNLRRENIAAALENCNEIISYGTVKGMDVTEYEAHRETLLARLAKTRSMTAARFWEEVFRDEKTAPSRFAAMPFIIAGDGQIARNSETGGLYCLFYVGKGEEKRVACRFAACEAPFVQEAGSPLRLTVHGRFLSAANSAALLYPCYFLGTFETPWQ